MGANTISKKHYTGREREKEKEPRSEVLSGNPKETKRTIMLLNQLLANYSVHYQKLRNYHWNVKGSDFFDLHEEFEAQYNEARMNIDEIAERIRVFGATPLSTLEDYLRTSEIEETGTDISSTEMVVEILKDYEILVQNMLAIVKVSSDSDDSGTEGMIKRFIRKVEKHHWMLSAFSEK